jgi:hypothetical protein
MVRLPRDALIANHVIWVYESPVQVQIVYPVENFPEKLTVIEVSHAVRLKQYRDALIVSSGDRTLIVSHGPRVERMDMQGWGIVLSGSG